MHMDTERIAAVRVSAVSGEFRIRRFRMRTDAAIARALCVAASLERARPDDAKALRHVIELARASIEARKLLERLSFLAEQMP